MARGATFTVYRTWVDGNTLTASDLNSALAQYITNGDASGIGSYFISLAEMRTTADPVLGVPENLLVWMHYMHYKLIEIGKARGITLTNWDDDIPGVYALSTGTDTITATFNSALTAHTTGMPLLIKAGGTNTGATTFNPNGIGGKNVLVGADALSAGHITINKGYWLMYDGTQYQLLNPEVLAPDSITNIAGNTTITAAQMTGRVRFYNSAQAAITLPAATAGLTATFEIVNSGGVRFIRNGTDTFSCGGTASLTALPGGTNYDIVVGGIYELTCYVAGAWTAKRKGVQPTFVLQKTDTQTIGTSYTKVTFATSVLDNGSIVSSSTATPKLAGIWEFGVRMFNGSANADISMKVYKNGAALEYTEDEANSTTYSSTMSFSLPILVATATEYYEIWGVCSIGTVNFYDPNVQSLFWGKRMSD